MFLVPNILIRPKLEIQRVLSSYLSGDRLSAAMNTMTKRPPISPLDSLSGMSFRFKEIKVMDNHASFLNWDSPADVYAMAFVTSDASPKPFDITFTGICNGVKDNNELPNVNVLDIARTFNSIPHFQDIHVVVMKSSQSKRDIAKAVSDALLSSEGTGLVGTLNHTFENLASGEVLHVATSLLSHICTNISNDTDEQLFYGIISFEDDPDDLGLGKTWVLTDNRNVKVSFEVVGKLSEGSLQRKSLI